MTFAAALSYSKFMLATRLVLLEGLAGTGKSTLGQKLGEMLTHAGFPAEFIHEFNKRNPVQVGDLTGVVEWQEAVRDKWEQFLQDTLRENQSITLMDAAFLQCPVSELLERGADTGHICSFVTRIRDRIQTLRPVVIYLYQQNIESAMRSTFESRSTTWQQKVTTFLIDTPFARKHSATGFDLYLELNRQIRQICDEIVEKLPFRVIRIDTSRPHWPTIHWQLAADFNIS